MPDRGLLPLVLAEAPAAVLLLHLDPGAAPRLVAADAGAHALAGTATLPADLSAWRRSGGFGSGGPWEQVARGEPVGGVRLPEHLWLTAVPVGGDRVLVALRHVETPPGAPGEQVVVTVSPGCVLSEPRPEAGGAFVVTWAGPGHTRTTGTPATEVVGQPVRTLLPTPGAPAAAVELERPEPVAITVLDRRGDGTSFLHRVRTSPLLDAAGQLGHLVSWHDDVTGRVAAEVELEAARAVEELALRRLELLEHLDEVAGVADVVVGLQAVADLLVRHVVEDALVVLTASRPGSPPGVAAEVVAAAGPALTGLAGRRLPRDTATVSDWAAQLVADVSSTPAVALPLTGRHGVVGLLVVLAGDGLDAADALVAAVAARRSALLVEAARAHAREEALAGTLRRSMVPEQADVDGLDVWTFHAPEDEDSLVGGDFYDVLQTSPDVAAVVIGDVVGHDVEAAAAMGQIRSVVRTYAHGHADPGSVLMRVDQLASGLRIPRRASLVVAMLSRLDDGEWEMSWSSAGHLPPLLRRGSDGSAVVEVLSDGTGTRVGLGDRPRPTRDRSLSRGDVLVFYTDGLVQTRDRSAREGLSVLVQVLETAKAADAAGIGEELLTALGESPGRDTAMVVVRVPREAADAPARAADTPRRRRWQLPSDPSSIGKGRHATLRACAVWGLDCGPPAEIVVSELVANAVLHGWGTVGLRLFETPDGLRIEVEDDSPEEPRVVDPRPDGSGGHGMRVVSRLGRWGWQPTRKGKIVWVELASSSR